MLPFYVFIAGCFVVYAVLVLVLKRAFLRPMLFEAKAQPLNPQEWGKITKYLVKFSSQAPRPSDSRLVPE